MQTLKLDVVLLFVLLLLSISRAQTVHEHKSSTNGIEAGSFMALMTQAMERMHMDMSIVPSGDPDRDFAAMMIPHHQGAVDMAKVQLQFGRDAILRRLAQAIIVEQQQEIDVMRRELSRLPSSSGDSAASPTMQTHSNPATREP